MGPVTRRLQNAYTKLSSESGVSIPTYPHTWDYIQEVQLFYWFIPSFACHATDLFTDPLICCCYTFVFLLVFLRARRSVKCVSTRLARWAWVGQKDYRINKAWNRRSQLTTASSVVSCKPCNGKIKEPPFLFDIVCQDEGRPDQLQLLLTLWFWYNEFLANIHGS